MLIRPYCVFVALCFSVQWLFWKFTDVAGNFSSETQLLLYVAGSWALWFLPVLFLTEVVFYFLLRLVGGSRKGLVCVLLVLLFVGYLLNGIYLPLSVGALPLALVFYGIGWLLRQLPLAWEGKTLVARLCLVVVLLVANVTLCYLNEARLDMRVNGYGSYFITVCAAMSGIIAFIVLSQIVCIASWGRAVFRYLGQNSLVILGTHQIIIIYLTVVLTVFGIMGLEQQVLKNVLFVFMTVICIEYFKRHPSILQGKANV